MKKLLIIVILVFSACSQPHDKYVDQYEKSFLNKLDDPRRYEFVSFQLGKLNSREERKGYHSYRLKNNDGQKKLYRAVILFDMEDNFIRIEEMVESRKVIF